MSTQIKYGVESCINNTIQMQKELFCPLQLGSSVSFSKKDSGSLLVSYQVSVGIEDVDKTRLLKPIEMEMIESHAWTVVNTLVSSLNMKANYKYSLKLKPFTTRWMGRVQIQQLRKLRAKICNYLAAYIAHYQIEIDIW